MHLQKNTRFSIGVNADRYCPTENLRTWNVEEAVKIDYGEIGTCTLEATPSATIMSMFQDTVDAYPDHPALGEEELTNNSVHD